MYSVINIVNRELRKNKICALSSLEIILLKGISKDLTYSAIGKANDYSHDYLTNVAAPKLYKKLSKLLDQNVTKKNCRLLLESYICTTFDLSPLYPTGAIALDSPFYIDRPPLEELAYEEINKPGALIRIKAPKETGKTSLLLRVLHHAIECGYKKVNLNLAQIDRAILSDLDRFLRFICASAAQQLSLESKLDLYWDEDIGSKVSCSLYFRRYLLEQIDSPIVLAFDELHRLFEYPQVTQDVLPLLRSWYEDGKRTPVWQKLRLIVVHSTEVYVPLRLNQSPFNVGLPIQLPNFELDRVIELAQKYQLDWQSGEEAKQLINLVGGHPALIQISLYHLSRHEITMTELLQTASTPESIYRSHLRRQWLVLQQEPELAESFRLLLLAERPLQLQTIVAYKLSSAGLIEQIGDEAIVSCQLYRDYFTKNFAEMK